jgi:hypothetical protein
MNKLWVIYAAGLAGAAAFLVVQPGQAKQTSTPISVMSPSGKDQSRLLNGAQTALPQARVVRVVYPTHLAQR